MILRLLNLHLKPGGGSQSPQEATVILRSASQAEGLTWPVGLASAQTVTTLSDACIHPPRPTCCSVYNTDNVLATYYSTDMYTQIALSYVNCHSVHVTMLVLLDGHHCPMVLWWGTSNITRVMSGNFLRVSELPGYQCGENRAVVRDIGMYLSNFSRSFGCPSDFIWKGPFGINSRLIS